MSAATARSAVLAALCLSLSLFQAAAATPPARAGAATGTQSATDTDKSAQALRQERLRQCKELTGDEKAACERDAREVSAEKARRDAHANGAPTGSGKAAQSNR
jgi:hypothetical protein